MEETTMRVLAAGATGVLGTALVPMLTAAGHEVIALSRSGRHTGAASVRADALDRGAVTDAVRQAAPDAIGHLLTAIPREIDARHMARDFALTNRLRTEGTANLLDAAAQVGVRRVLTQGLAFAYDPSGTGLADEDTPFWPRPPKQVAAVLAAVRELEQRTHDSGGLVLRFGHLYGPGSAFAADGSFTGDLRQGSLPVVGRGSAVFSFIHAHDAATAMVAALEQEVSGALNIVDDDPAPVREWVPEVAELLGAPKPRHIPKTLARMAVGSWGAAFMTSLRGADNARAKQRLGWEPQYASWRTGFAAELRAVRT